MLDNHPRYKNLCEIYGEPEIATKARAAGDPAAGTLEARIVRFTFRLSSDDGTTSKAEETIVEKTQDIPRTIDVYALKGIVGRLFGIRPMGCKLIWETGEWDPVKGDEDGWSCSEEEELARELADNSNSSIETGNPDFIKDGAEKCKWEQKQEQKQKQRDQKKWTRREIELEDGTRDVGFWIEGREAVVRVERR